MKHPTVALTGAVASVDSAWEQEKLEARKMSERASESPASTVHIIPTLLRDALLDGFH